MTLVLQVHTDLKKSVKISPICVISVLPKSKNGTQMTLVLQTLTDQKIRENQPDLRYQRSKKNL